MERINLSSIKKESVRAIFAAIAAKNQISRAEIAEITGLSLMTVGKVVDALLERSIVSQLKEVKNVAGRRAGLVSLNCGKYFLVIDLTSRAMTMSVIDLALNIVESMSYEYNRDFYYEENLYIFMKNVKIYILRHLNTDDTVGIGVVLPGDYHAETDSVENSRIPELAKTRVRGVIEDVLRMPVTMLEKDVLAAAVSNLSDLERENIASAAYVCIGETLSGVLIANGKLLNGRGGYAGDIGRIPSGGRTLHTLFHTRGFREETASVLGEALAYEILLFDPAVIIIENNCVGVRMESLRPYLIAAICKVTGWTEDKLPEIRIVEAGVRHAYRGIAIGMREEWIQKEVD